MSRAELKFQGEKKRGGDDVVLKAAKFKRAPLLIQPPISAPKYLRQTIVNPRQQLCAVTNITSVLN